jgi:hypothetical protein
LHRSNSTKPEDTDEYYYTKCADDELTEHEAWFQVKMRRELRHREAVRRKRAKHEKLLKRVERQKMMRLVESHVKRLDGELHIEEALKKEHELDRQRQKRERDETKHREWERNVDRAVRLAQRKTVIVGQ